MKALLTVLQISLFLIAAIILLGSLFVEFDLLRVSRLMVILAILVGVVRHQL